MNDDYERSTFKIIKEGKEIECEALFEFTSGLDEKNYIVYTTYSSDKKGNIEIHAGVFDPESESGELEPVDSNEEWEIVENFLESVSEETDDEDDAFMEEIKKNWIQSILYYKYVVLKEKEKVQYNQMKLPIGYKREYKRSNKYNLKKMVVRAPEMIEAIHKKIEKKIEVKPVVKEKPIIKVKPISKEKKEKFKPSKEVSPIYGELGKHYSKDDIVQKKKIKLPEIIEKANNGLELSEDERIQLDKYLEKQLELKRKEEVIQANVGKRRM